MLKLPFIILSVLLCMLNVSSLTGMETEEQNYVEEFEAVDTLEDLFSEFYLNSESEEADIEPIYEPSSSDAQAIQLLSSLKCEPWDYDLDGICKRDDYTLKDYNALRKLLHKKRAKTVAQIDEVWLEKQEYYYWKKEKLHWFNAKKLDSLEQQEFIRHTLFIQLDLQDKDKDYDKQFFRWFNLLRELVGEKPSFSYYCKKFKSPLKAEYFEWLVKKAADIISAVHQNAHYTERAYTLWRDNTLSELRPNNSFHNMVLFLIKEVNRSLELIDYDDTGSSSAHACDTYNILRDLLELEKIPHYSHINSGWLDEVAEEVLTLQKKVDTDDKAAQYELKKEMIEPDAAQQALLKHAKKATGIEEDILLLSSNKSHRGFAGESIIGLNNFPDLDYQLFLIYHELGHIFYKDAEALEYDFYELPESDDFKTVEAVTEIYVEKAKSALDSSSALGKQLKDIVSSTATFWIPQEDTAGKLYLRQLTGRMKEKRADLFALEKLYEQDKINAIIRWIHDLAFGDKRDGNIYVTVTSFDVHPSDIERALYSVGFLVEKGLDITRLFQQWEEQGECEPIENILREERSAETALVKGNRTKSLLYQALIEHNNHNYKQWKKSNWYSSPWRKSIAIADDSWDYFFVLCNALDAWNAYQQIPNDNSRALALNTYNFLREVAGEGQVTSSYDIDKTWMQNLYAELWSKSLIQAYKTLHLTEKEQISNLSLEALSKLSFTSYYSYLSEEQELAAYFFGEPFYSKNLFNGWSEYNLLRKLLGKETAKNPHSVDYAWLVDFGFQLWKQEIENVFKQQGFAFDQQIEFCTKTYLAGITAAFKHFNIQTPVPHYTQRTVLDSLYSYNMARELLNRPKAKFVRDIDQRWVFEELIQNQSVSFCPVQQSVASTDHDKLVAREKEIVKLMLIALKYLEPFEQKPKELKGLERVYGVNDLLKGWCAYSLLRTMLDGDKTGSTKYQIDYDWLKDFSFQLWKRNVEKIFEQKGFSFVQKIEYLASFNQFEYNSTVNEEQESAELENDSESTDSDSTDMDCSDLNKLYSYNLMREYFKEQKTTHKLLINYDWIQSALNAAYSKAINN